MSVGKMLKDTFNWLADKPSHQYTLGGDKHSVKFNRAARFVERVNTITGVAFGAGIALLGVPAALMGVIPVAASALTVGVAFAIAAKAVGMVKGGIVHLGAKGVSSLANHLSKPKAPAQA